MVGGLVLARVLRVGSCEYHRGMVLNPADLVMRTIPPPAPRSTSSINEGATLGPYRLLNLLGEGSGGRVFRAVHTKLDRQVAVKVLRSEHANKRNLVRRFFQEARLSNQIQHENIVEITDLVTEESGSCYIIMELLLGESLEHVL